MLDIYKLMGLHKLNTVTYPTFRPRNKILLVFIKTPPCSLLSPSPTPRVSTS